MISEEYHPDFGELPKSKGIPTALVVSIIVGVIMIFAIGAGVVLMSGYGHHWPYLTNLRINLSAKQ